jgi:hypothetical protein
MGSSYSLDSKIHELQQQAEKHPERVKEYQKQVIDLIGATEDAPKSDEIDFFNQITKTCSKKDVENIISIFNEHKKELMNFYTTADVCNGDEKKIMTIIREGKYDDYTTLLYTAFFSSFFKCVTNKNDCEYLVDKYTREE